MKIVIVAGFIFPRISPRSFRATELAKAFAKEEHDVTLMASLGKFDYTDFKKKYNVKVKDIGTPFFAVKNSDGKLNTPLWKKGVAFCFNRLLEFPDICLSKRVKDNILNEKDIDLLITIAIPYPIHWGAALIRQKDKNFKTWISDCGDPYMGNSLKKPPFYFKYIEKWWCRKTDFITVPIEQARSSFYDECKNKIFVIPQGFDFSEVKLSTYKENIIPTFLYAGLFYQEKRDPTNFLKYISSLDANFKFIIYTSNSKLLIPFKEVLNNKIEIHDSIERESLMTVMSKMDFLLNISNKGTDAQFPSKLIDYAITKRPVLEITSDFNDEEKKNFELFLKKDYSNQYLIKNMDIYNIENIVQKFIKLNELNNE